MPKELVSAWGVRLSECFWVDFNHVREELVSVRKHIEGPVFPVG